MEQGQHDELTARMATPQATYHTDGKQLRIKSNKKQSALPDFPEACLQRD